MADYEVNIAQRGVRNWTQEIERQGEPQLHERLTQLLCELTAYDLMQSLNMMQSARPTSKFRG